MEQSAEFHSGWSMRGGDDSQKPRTALTSFHRCAPHLSEIQRNYGSYHAMKINGKHKAECWVLRDDLGKPERMALQ